MDVGEQRVSRAVSGDVLSVSHQSVGGRETSPVTSADDECLSSVESGRWWQDGLEVAHEAETDRASVEAWRVSASAVPAATFVDLSVVTNAEIVADVSPTVVVHVHILDISHLSVAESLGGTTSSSGVVNDKVGWWLGGKPGGICSASAPLLTSSDVGAGSSLSICSNGE